ncbi:MAG TPA: P-loop NTPase fold protein [Hanamia sp.]|nr:P-loop NTPase fold protein [Hanamia sp.]
MEKQEFPKFIQNKATGTDSFEGRSAERVANALEFHIRKTTELNEDKKNNLPQIIGLEGAWGSGKSNVIRILKNNVKKDYHVFEYDAWGNQEDLQRRSFLEQLTQELIKEKILIGQTTIKKRGGGEETVTWSEKLEYLLARKTKTISEKYPRISNGMAAIGLVAILTPIFVFIGYIIKATNINSGWATLISIIISILPGFVSLIVWGRACRKDARYKDWGYLLAIYNDKIENAVKYETISDNEPTVSEFKAWMSDISEFINPKGAKKIILVFDNMDRLPSEKVRELWSSIHTFFSEDGNKNIWVIIPFDKKHLANAFGDNEKEDKKELTSQFLAKTFPITYKVPPAILTDRKEIFNKFFTDAFGTTEEEAKEKLQRIFSIVNSNFTPRDIIAFINEVVSLKQTWENDIPLIPIGIFILRKEQILANNIDEYILANSYLDQIERIIENTEELQKYITALTYGINTEMAAQIPLKQYLKNTLKGEKDFDINKFSGNKHFISVLDDEIKSIDPAIIDNSILTLSKLNVSTGVNITPLWNELSRIYLRQNLAALAFEKTQEALLLNANEPYKRKIAKYLCKSYRVFNEFKGSSFFKAMQSLEEFISNNNLKIEIGDYIEPFQVNPETFIEYVSEAKEDFHKYKISCDNKKLDEALEKAAPASLPSMDFIQYLVKDNLYEFSGLTQSIEKAISDNLVDASSFPQLIKAYKFVSKEKPLKVKFTNSQVQTLINATTEKTSAAYYDLVAMSLASQFIDTAYEENLDHKVAGRIEFYENYDSLLKLTVAWSSQLLRKAVRIITQQPFGDSKLNIVDILPQYKKIRDAISVDDVVFLNKLNEWSKFAQKEITIANIEEVIPNYDFYKSSEFVKNSLTEHINKVAIEKLGSIQTADIYADRNNASNYWLNSAALLIQGKNLETIPDNLTDFCRKILNGISKGEAIPASGHFIDIIINKADKGKLVSTIISLGEDFCNKDPLITPPQFLYFSNNFDFIKKIKNRDGAITRNIINTVITDNGCLEYILENSTTYTKIINNSGNEGEELKEKIRQIMTTHQSDKLMNFAKSVGIGE